MSPEEIEIGRIYVWKPSVCDDKLYPPYEYIGLPCEALSLPQEDIYVCNHCRGDLWVVTLEMNGKKTRSCPCDLHPIQDPDQETETNQEEAETV